MYLFKLWRHRDSQNTREKMFNIANWNMYRDFINRSHDIFINSFHYRYSVDDLNPPSFVRKLLGPSVQTFIQNDVVTLWVGYFMSCLPRQLKNLHGPFTLTFYSWSSTFGNLWAVIWSASMESSYSREAETQCLLKCRLESLAKLKRSWRKLCEETWNRMNL